MMQTTFCNARLVLDDDIVRGTLAVTGGRIEAVDGRDTGVRGAIDLEGDYLMPGLVEIHTDNLERHLMPRPKVHWAEVPALIAHDREIIGAGITTVLDALGIGEGDPTSLRGNTWETMVRCLDECIQHEVLRAEHLLHVRCELPAPNTVELFAPFHGHPRLRLMSLMDHTPGQRQWESNLESARAYYVGKKAWSEERFATAIRSGPELQARYARPHRAHFADYSRAHGIALASHDDTTAAHVEEAHADGAALSEFPTTTVAAATAHRLGLRVVMGGPNLVRGRSHSGNVAASDLVRDGLVDILSSDYVPGSLLGGAFALHHQHGIALPRAVAMVSRNPAAAVGLSDRGRLLPGARADLVQVHPLALSDGTVRPVVRAVWREGRRVA
jgi:alpha-D-ribose 1-methylphosphonate 5-triphosphate diphosphatase